MIKVNKQGNLLNFVDTFFFIEKHKNLFITRNREVARETAKCWIYCLMKNSPSVCTHREKRSCFLTNLIFPIDATIKCDHVRPADALIRVKASRLYRPEIRSYDRFAGCEEKLTGDGWKLIAALGRKARSVARKRQRWQFVVLQE